MEASNSGRPELLHGRGVGQADAAFAGTDRDQLHLAGGDRPGDCADRIEHQRHVAAHYVVKRLGSALVGHVQHLCFGHDIEQFAREVRHRAGSKRRHGKFARLGLGEGHEFLDIIGRQRWIEDERHRIDHQHRYRREALDRIPRHFADQRIGSDRAGSCHEERVAIGSSARDRFVPERARSPADIVDNDGLLESLAKLRPEDARDRVGAAARREGNDQPDAARWIVLCGKRRGSNPDPSGDERRGQGRRQA